MRVAFLSAQAAFLDAVSRQQSALARIQEQVATGRKFTSASDDPVGATQSLTLDAVIATNERYVTNGTLATNRLQLEEGALTGVGDLLQRVRELTLQAANGPQSAEIRQLIAAEVRARLDELVATANTRDGNGEYLFAGTATATQPFVRNAGSVVYQGDQVQRLVQIGPDQYVADSDAGSSIFELVRNGNGVYAVAGEAANTGTGRVAQRAVTDATQYDQGSYRIQFTTADAWQVLDASNAVIASGSYQAGDAIEFRGLSLTLEGAPAAGDQFNVTPSVNQSMFRTLENLLATLERPDGTPARPGRADRRTGDGAGRSRPGDRQGAGDPGGHRRPAVRDRQPHFPDRGHRGRAEACAVRTARYRLRRGPDAPRAAAHHHRGRTKGLHPHPEPVAVRLSVVDRPPSGARWIRP